jgi:ribosomal protein L37E
MILWRGTIMLGLKVEFEISKGSMPFYFNRKNECVSCGNKNTLIFVDKFGNESNKEIRAFDHTKCKACGRIYSIKWDRDSSDGKMYPSAVEPNLKRDFANMIDKNIKNKGIKKID